MKKVVGLWLVLMLVFVPQAFGQDKSKATENPKPVTPVKLQITLLEYDGDKKVASLPYSLIVEAQPDPDVHMTNFARVGVRVPIPGAGKEGKAEFQDVGSNIDCGVRTDGGGQFTVRLNFERSSLYFQGAGDEKGTLRTTSAGQPYVPTMRATTIVMVKDGQTVEAFTLADPLNGHVFRLELAVNVLK
jgi:hypothetical protein